MDIPKISSELKAELEGLSILEVLKFIGKKLFKTAASQAADRAMGAMVKKFPEKRDEMRAFISVTLRDRNPTASDNLLRRWDERQAHQNGFRPGDETRFSRSMTQLYDSLGGDDEKEQRIRFFEHLGLLDDVHFNLALASMRNDDVLQVVQRLWEHAHDERVVGTLRTYRQWAQSLPGGRGKTQRRQ